MTDLPQPLAPSWLNITSHDWYPLYFDRLRRSKWWRRATDTARARNIMLWGEAYKQVPAGSMPDDDDELAEAAGYGMDLDAFLAAKDEIMAPWTLCSDGRWYHPTVVEMAQEAWSRLSERRQKERLRKSHQRLQARGEMPDVPPDNDGVPRDIEPVPQDIAPVPRDTPQKSVGHSTQTDRQTDRTVGSNEPVASAPQPATARIDPWRLDEMFQILWGACTPEMRRRAKSQAKVWPEWVRAKKLADPQVIVSGMGVYLLTDPDVKRSGGPGLHLWLRDRTWEACSPLASKAVETWDEDRWAVAVGIWRSDGRWDDRLGPEPGEPGCRVPPHLILHTAREAVA